MTTTPGGAFDLHADCRAAVETTAKALADLGHEVLPSHPEALDDRGSVWHFIAIVGCSVARALDATAEKLGRPVVEDDVEPLTWTLARMADGITAAKYIASIDAVHALGRRMELWWDEGFDLLLTPTTAQPAPRIGELDPGSDDPIAGWTKSAPFGCFTSPFNQTGQPAISLPTGFSEECAVPVGVQLVAGYGREDLLLRVAAQLEQVLPWKDRRPPSLP